MRRRRMEETIGNSFTTLATKIAKDERIGIAKIASSFNMSIYELLQSLLLALLRYFDSGRLITFEHNCMMNALANTIYSLKGSYNPLGTMNKEKRNMTSAIAFLSEKTKKKKKKPQLIYISRNDEGQTTETYNYDRMLSDFLNCLDPDALVRLEAKKKELGYFSITHTLHEIIMQKTSKTDEIKADIKEMFNDSRIPSGESINDEILYKRDYRKNLDEYTTYQTTKKQTYRADL